MLGEVEGGVEFDPEDSVGLRGVDGRDGGGLRVNGNVLCRQDARRLRLARERTLHELHSAPVVQHLRTLTISPMYALKRESFLSWMVILVGEPVARLRSSANPWPMYVAVGSVGSALVVGAPGR
jgi:hypothetical protein